MASAAMCVFLTATSPPEDELGAIADGEPVIFPWHLFHPCPIPRLLQNSRIVHTWKM
jgi:hypothetical protein